MSKHNNVNPDHYTVAGRERPGNAVAKAPKASAEEEKTRARWMRKQEEISGDRRSGDRRSNEKE
jgi:hypothetical protein